MPSRGGLDPIDARILLELCAHPRATTSAVADQVGVARNTAHARLARLEDSGALGPFERRIDLGAVGYPLTAFVTALVTQRMLDEVSRDLALIPEVIQVFGLSGDVDLLIHVVARSAEDLYRVAGQVLAINGVERTSTGLVMRDLVGYRVRPLLERAAEQ